MTEQQYRQKIDAFLQLPSFSKADDDFFKGLEELTNEAKQMIYDNDEDLTTDIGTTYYVSNNGDDNNDGKSPERAWKTLEKSNGHSYNFGDLVVFERGGFWRGHIDAKSGVSYSAYGVGPKPKIWAAYDGKQYEWVKTDMPNVWRYEEVYPTDDIPCIFFNDGSIYADKKDTFAGLQNDLDFIYNSDWSFEKNNDNKVYLYSEQNPKERFDAININQYYKLIEPENGNRPHDVTVKNLELLYGRGAFMATMSTNMRMSYCVCGFSGGHYAGKTRHVRYGGGAGGWHSSHGFYFDHCYFYQQFDSGVTPQYDDWTTRNEPAIFYDFVTTDCIFETTEYTLEYFNTQNNFDNNGFVNMIFSYNLCLLGGHGFGDKTQKSRYIKSWNHENNCIGCDISHNIFDRAASLSLEVIGHDYGKRGEAISYNALPKLHHNVYIEPKDKIWADINLIKYPFNLASKITLEQLNVDKNSTYIYSE